MRRNLQSKPASLCFKIFCLAEYKRVLQLTADGSHSVAIPELWTGTRFYKLFKLIRINGIPVTCSSKVIVCSTMQAAGFSVEKIGGLFGKREL